MIKEKIKAIETVYNGYKFRSRLEARWAVFFDELGVKYFYESEGYDLHYTGYYLPDFIVPSSRGDVFLEIKPEPKYKNNPLAYAGHESIKKCVELSLMHKGFAVLVFGDPLEHVASWFFDGTLEYPGSAMAFEDITATSCSLFPTFYHKQKPYPPPDYHEMEYTHKEQAIVARQARFEHGEICGKKKDDVNF